MSAVSVPWPGDDGYRLRLLRLLPALLVVYVVLVWPLLYARGTVTADLVTGPMPETQSYLLNRLVFPMLAALAMVLSVAERHRLGRFHLAGALLVGGFFAYLGATALWALAPSTSAAKFALLMTQVIPLAAAALAARRVEEVMVPLFWVMAATLLVNVLSVAVVKSTPIGFPGIYAHKNSLGNMAAVGGFFGLYGLAFRRGARAWAGAAMVIAAVGLLVLSRSKTASGLFVLVPFLALGALVVRRHLRIALPILLVAAALPAGFLLGGGVSGFSYHDLSMLVSGDGTFTGRTEIWSFAATHIAERPVFGYGYQSFWGIGDLSPAASLPDGFVSRTPHAHNGYLDLLLQGGTVALVLFVVLLVMVARWIDRLDDADPRLGLLATTILFYLIVQNLLETDWLQGLSGTSLLGSLWIVLAAGRRDGRALT